MLLSRDLFAFEVHRNKRVQNDERNDRNLSENVVVSSDGNEENVISSKRFCSLVRCRLLVLSHLKNKSKSSRHESEMRMNLCAATEETKSHWRATWSSTQTNSICSFRNCRIFRCCQMNERNFDCKQYTFYPSAFISLLFVVAGWICLLSQNASCELVRDSSKFECKSTKLTIDYLMNVSLCALTKLCNAQSIFLRRWIRRVWICEYFTIKSTWSLSSQILSWCHRLSQCRIEKATRKKCA